MAESTTFDPLKYIPSADAVRKRLAETRELARRLGILLHVAEAIEREARNGSIDEAVDAIIKEGQSNGHQTTSN
jgi:hypothetical protein